MNACILHDQMVAPLGGAERVAFEQARALDAPIYVGLLDAETPVDVEVVELFDDRIGQRCMRSHNIIKDAYQMLAWQHLPAVYDYDLVVVNKTNPGWFVPKDDQASLWYVHSTPRGMYDRFPDHGASYVTAAVKSAMRTLYRGNEDRADVICANSELVARRLDRYWSCDSRVIYPPVECAAFAADVPRPSDAPEEYHFTWSRLRDHKGLVELIAAAKGSDHTLVIGGDGPELDRYREMASGHDNITILGPLDKASLVRWVSHAESVPFAAHNEDFGMVPIEALAAGTPVLAVDDGYTKHQVIEGKTGYVWGRGPQHLVGAMDRVVEQGVDWSPAEISEWAVSRFSVDRFRERIRDEAQRAMDKARVRAPWEREQRQTETMRERLRADGGDEA